MPFPIDDTAANPYGVTQATPGQQAAQAPASAIRNSSTRGGNVPAGWTRPTVKMLEMKHPDYTDMIDDWVKLGFLYEGGHVIRKNATQFLIRRPRELQEIYQARVDRFTYHNILGTCFGWYRAALFKEPPQIQFNIVDDNGQKTDTKPKQDSDQFFTDFRKNCDRHGTSFVDQLRDVFTSLALYRKAFVLVDNPENDPDTVSLADQKKKGVIDKNGKPLPYTCVYAPASVINWELDDAGNMIWAMIATQSTRRPDFTKDAVVVNTWYYYDQKQFMKWEFERRPGESQLAKLDENQRATLVDFGPHALSKQNKLPLIQFEVTDGLWLANRAYLPVLDHLNQDNSYGWALYMANLCMPVIKSERDYKPTLSEAGFIQLGPNDEYGWSEPEGKSFERSEQRVRELREEIFRAMYLTYQGRQSTATADGASGASKEMDMMPAQDVMNEYGDVVVAAAQTILDYVALARGEVTLKSDVRGMKFGKTATIDDIEKSEAVKAIGVPSRTFEKEVYKACARAYFPDMNPETQDAIEAEIDAAPTDEEKQQALAEQQTQQFSQKLKQTVQSYGQPPAPPTPPKQAPKKGAAALV